MAAERYYVDYAEYGPPVLRDRKQGASNPRGLAMFYDFEIAEEVAKMLNTKVKYTLVLKKKA